MRVRGSRAGRSRGRRREHERDDGRGDRTPAIHDISSSGDTPAILRRTAYVGNGQTARRATTSESETSPGSMTTKRAPPRSRPRCSRCRRAAREAADERQADTDARRARLRPGGTARRSSLRSELGNAGPLVLDHEHDAVRSLRGRGHGRGSCRRVAPALTNRFSTIRSTLAGSTSRADCSPSTRTGCPSSGGALAQDAARARRHRSARARVASDRDPGVRDRAGRRSAG